MRTFRATNPATGELLDPAFETTTLDEVDRLANRAAEAFAAFKDASGKAKGALLRAIAANLEANGEAIVQRANLETALPLARLQGELGRTCGQLRLFAALVEEGSWVAARIDHGDPTRKPAPRPDLRSMLRPLGPVAVFGASNFPLAFSVAGGDTASALAAGCPVIVKAHPAHPGTSRLAADAIEKAVPDGVFGIIFESGFEAGVALVQHPAIKAVGFTGSRRGGDALARAVAQRAQPIPLYAEMGSINPVFVLPGAMRERGDAIAAGLHASVTLGVGQFCTNPGVVVSERISNEFVRDLESRMAATPAAPMLTLSISEAYRTGVAALAATPGVSCGAGLQPASPPGAQAGSLRHTGDGIAALFTTDARTFLGNDALTSEVFGPSTLVVDCADRAQLLDVARRLEGQLTVTIHATEEDVEAHRDLIALLETKAGRIVFNGYPTGVEVSHAIVHGGPYPATSDGRSTSVGTRAIERFTRPVCWQDAPETALPDELKESNPLAIRRLVDGAFA